MADNSAQNTAQALEQAKQRMKELNEEVKRLGGEGFGDINALVARFGTNLTDANKQVKLMQDEVNDLKNAFGNISDTLKNVVADIQGSTKASTLLTRNFNKLEDYSRKIQDHKKGDAVLSVKELKSIEKKVAKEMESLNANLKEAKAQERILLSKQRANELSKSEADELAKNVAYQKEIKDAMADQASYLNQIVPLTAQEVKEEEKLQKTLGLTGMAFKGISGALEKIGVDSKYFENINDKLREAAKTGSQWNVISAGTKGIFKGIGQALADPVGKILLLIGLAKQLVDLGLHFNKQAAELGKEYGLAGENAREMVHAIEAMSVGSNNLLLNSKNVTEAMSQMNEELGTSSMFTEDLIAGQIDLTKKMGMSGEEAAKISDYALLTGKSQNDIVKGITGQNKGILSNKKVLQEVAKTEGQLAAFYKNDPILIGKAVIQAQKLGMTLNQTKQVTDSLLDIESSLQNEYEAEALIGKDINLNQARYLAMMGDTAGAAKEVLANVGGINGFMNLNRIQQDALAKSMGMSSDELANTLTKQEKLSKLSGAQRAEIEKLRKSGQADKADAIEKAVMEGKSVDMAKQQMATEEKLAAAAQKFKDIIASLVAGPIGGLLDGLADGLSIINKIFKALSFLKVPLMIIGGIFGTIWAASKGILLTQKLITGAKMVQAAWDKKDLITSQANFFLKQQQLGTEKSLAVASRIQAVTEKQSLGYRTLYNIQLLAGLVREQGLVGLKTYAATLDEKSLARKVLMFTYDKMLLPIQEAYNALKNKGLMMSVREFAIEKGKAAVLKIQTLYESISNKLKQQGILLTIKDAFKSIAQAAMKVYSSAASIPFVGWAIGAAAAAAVVGLGMKLMTKGNDVVSPGYGKRTLMAPEGAIALNDKDTVIAGTDLGGKKKGGGGNEIKSAAAPAMDLTPLINAVNQVTAAVNGLVDRPTSVFLDGVQLAQKLQAPMSVATRRTG